MVSVSFPSSSIFGIRKRGNMVSAMLAFRFDTAREGFIGYAERERGHRLNRGCFFFDWQRHSRRSLSFRGICRSLGRFTGRSRKLLGADLPQRMEYGVCFHFRQSTVRYPGVEMRGGGVA